jgi:uncharacterized protein YjbJ (UPF0337 family)
MSEMANTSRTEHSLKRMGAKVKKAVGDIVGSRKMKNEGRTKEVEERAKESAASAKERAAGAKENIKGKGQELYGKAKGAVGDLSADERTRMEGKAKEIEGEVRQKIHGPS